MKACQKCHEGECASMADHFSGPRALAGPAGDICDAYAFPSPERPGHLVLVMTVHPVAPAGSCFSDAIVYRFRIRPVHKASGPPALPFGPEETERVFACTFDPPRPGSDGVTAEQDGYCLTPWGEKVLFRVNDERAGSGDTLHVYAGLRSDPFFFDLPAYLESIKGGYLAFSQPGRNTATDFNALGIVLEVDSTTLLQQGQGPLFGMVAETVVAGKIPIRLERFGRPEIKNVILFMTWFDQVNRDLEIRDLYNLEDAFHMSKDYRGAYRARFNANLAAIDRLDGTTDWPMGPNGSHPLTDLLLADYMVVDLSKPFSESSGLEIERALLQGHAHETCGGRWLDDDVIDTLYTWLITADKGARISDGVDQATVPASKAFPYLQPPNPPLSGAQLELASAITGRAV
jgi:hypothetical protein